MSMYRSSTNDGNPVCQYQMTTLEELGLLKMDFLGLRNLTVLDDAVRLVQKTVPDFRIEDAPEDDKATYEMLAAGTARAACSSLKARA